ncbi:accessory Sec system S-layer assembly protein [Thermolongibacillus altinsuensis]|uniref:Accessory Sec system S-layer assembly protein n=1 Tax=Thermolongibacillus altinsuensis TaxID=575256 RepID=A0A4R1QH94_9BACL|nr:accessory Sec system S-layer assembly protein [Thermolongibacillus altinsuensis]TCL52816.1 accessory Sec system S-layer assembly protein [Thermolongibacillus altinsuensis]
MFPFFKRKKQGEDSTVHASELLNEQSEQNEQSESEVKTELSLHPLMQVSVEQKYYYQFLNNELPPLKPNQISLSGIELKKENDRYVVTAFVRNSLEKAIRFEETTLLLIGPNGEMLGRKTFDLSELGELPPRSSRPWRFVFNESDMIAREVPTTGWKLAFELRKPHSLDLEESWEKSLAEADKEKLEQLVRTLKPPKPGEINFMGLQAALNAEGNLVVTMLIRNGSNKNIQIEQLPLVVEDASKEVVARGGFTLNLEVKANTSKPWTFIFPKSLLLKENIDLSQWRAYPPQQ